MMRRLEGREADRKCRPPVARSAPLLCHSAGCNPEVPLVGFQYSGSKLKVQQRQDNRRVLRQPTHSTIIIVMYFARLLLLVVAALALLAGGLAAPGKGSAIRKGAKVIGKGLKVIGVAGTAHEVYQSVRNRG
ncbi:hypothetical protein EVAR_45663_1 [Eumeta japonica]|uniref:Uncharacterized protein n=1 Tax=Eumeta variegata TaxID=151549 RepID=A0A4C1Y3B6_EUMVA|nr:hypothetical protein EVAR_45663_1 [Eumeta japonica]